LLIANKLGYELILQNNLNKLSVVPMLIKSMQISHICTSSCTNN